jgi:hypothetical protein
MKKRLAAIAAGLAATAGVLAWPSSHASAQTTTVLQIISSGNSTTAAFTTGSDWSLRYTFACPTTGYFKAVEHGGPANGVVLANENGPSERSTMYSHDSAGQHTITVTSNCEWTLAAKDGDTLPKAY